MSTGKKKDKVKQRSLALDALRGLAILTMCLSGIVPKSGYPPLPSWMFHAQIGPLDGYRYPGAELSRAGYTWVDLVFPAFLFAMGCAFPLALRSKLEKGIPVRKLIGSTLFRFVILVFFAIYANNLNPWALQWPPSNMTWTTGFLGFLALFPLIGLFPKSFPRNLVIPTRIAGLILCIGFLMYSGYVRTKWGTGSLPEQPDFLTAWLNHPGTLFLKIRNYSDIIIMVLANCALFGGIIYLFTSKNAFLRLGIMAIVFAMWRTSHIDGHWVNLLTTNSITINFLPEPIDLSLGWCYNFGYLKYLMIVLPGSVVGDLIYDWMKAREKEIRVSNRNPAAPAISLPQLSLCRSHYTIAAWVSFAIVVLFHIGFHAREMEMMTFADVRITWIMGTPFIIFAFMFFIWHLLKNGSSVTDQLLQKMFQWGVFWLILGMAFEPLKGGIKKDPSDVTYFFSSTGLSILLLFSFFITIDVFGKQFGFRLMILNGQNPMVAYMGIRNLLGPVFFFKALPTLTGWVSIQTIHDQLANHYGWTGWQRFILAAFKTWFLAWTVGWATRCRMFWKS